MRADLPSGTVTFLFTDVEGSTRLLHELGPERYAATLQEHRRVLRDCCRRHGGAEVDTQGDAFFFAFAHPAGAVAAAQDAQVELATGRVSVRMGLHTGLPHLTEEGYVGEDVHLGARVASAGHGGQVLLSAATRAALEPSNSLLLGELGEHRLKDFDRPIAIFQLGTGAFPPLRTISNTNLPRPASSFVGRERELAELAALLRGVARLVTMTGPGGTGKTRLAIEAAAELVPDFKAGVFWVPLATVRDPELVVPAIARTIGAQRDLAEHVGDRELLLLVDNLEQVVAIAPELAALVESCPNLKVLVTSRELLRVRGEVEYEVLPLADADGVALFTARSRRSANAAVEELCRRLDNMPLALELAAARTTVLSPEKILERLSQRLDLFTGGRDADPRQQTLRTTIEWSYDLLDESERALFAKLGVFAGGCTLEAAEAVVDADLDTLQSLVEKSLLRHTDDRFWMLETIREFAAERLEATAEADSVRRRLAQYLIDLAAASGLRSEVPAAGDVARVRAEMANIRDVLEWSEEEDPELGLRLAASIEGLWTVLGPIEGMRWYESLLERAPDAPLELRACALRGYGGAANPGGRDDIAERAYAESLDAFRALGDEAQAAELLLRLGYAALYRGDRDRARAIAEESLGIFTAAGHVQGVAQAIGLTGELDYGEGRRELGLQRLQESADRAGEAGFRWWRAGMLGKLADCHREHGQLDEAETCAREACAISQELGDRLRLVRGLARLARLAAERGEPERAGLLWGAVEADEERGPIGAWENERERYAQALCGVEEPDFDLGREKGRTLSLDEAVNRALSID
jgi:predicted ATPase/class 3 adenylate cyclase